MEEEDEGARFETFMACHLKKSIDYWNELRKGEFDLFYLRDKKQCEVDFLDLSRLRDEGMRI